MPCYYWKGIDFKGSIRIGTKFYRSENHLEQDLLSMNIGLIECRLKKEHFKQRVPTRLKEFFIEHLHTLLKSQIRLHQAIELCSHSVVHNYFKQIIDDIGSIVLEGQPLYKALALYPKIFDNLTVSIIAVGEESSNLTHAFEQLVTHGMQVKEFKAKMKAALFMPALTFGFFAIVITGFFVFVVPRFETFFQSFKAPLPNITQLVLALSSFVRSMSLMYLFVGFGMLYFLGKAFRSPVFAGLRDRLFFRVPVIKNISLMVFRLRFLQILSISLSSGMHLLGCLNLAYNNMTSGYIKKILKQIIGEIENGINLSVAINESVLNDLETIALIKIGESSGNLDQMISKALDLYQKKFYLKVDQISSLVHPLLLLILGILISLSIFAVYVPIFTLTSFIN